MKISRKIVQVKVKRFWDISKIIKSDGANWHSPPSPGINKYIENVFLFVGLMTKTTIKTPTKRHKWTRFSFFVIHFYIVFAKTTDVTVCLYSFNENTTKQKQTTKQLQEMVAIGTGFCIYQNKTNKNNKTNVQHW